jgi:hypothetical protein
VLTHLPDGSYLSEIAGLAVRISEAQVAMRGADGTQVSDSYRLITTLLDHHRYPAATLIRLYWLRCAGRAVAERRSWLHVLDQPLPRLRRRTTRAVDHDRRASGAGLIGGVRTRTPCTTC